MQAENDGLDILHVLYGLLSIITSVAVVGIGYWQYKLKKQEWTKNNWGVYLKNYKLTEKAMGIVGCLTIPDKNQWTEERGELNYGDKIGHDIDEAHKLIWQARDEATLFLDKKIFKYIERLFERITNLKNLYDEYRKTMRTHPECHLLDRDIPQQGAEEQRKKLLQAIAALKQQGENYVLVYRKVIALKK